MATIQSFTELLLSDAAGLVRDVYVPMGGTCILLGGVGAGKSQVFTQLGAELSGADPDFGFGYEIFGSYDAVDMRGMPLPARPDGFAAFSRPDWMRDCFYRERDGSYVTDGNGKPKVKPRGLFVIDEITQVSDPGAQNTLAPILLDGKVGEHGLPRGPNGWCFVALGNRVDDRANANRLPSLLWNRAAFSAHVRADADGWRTWAMRPRSAKGGAVPLPFVIFAGREAGVVFTGKSPLEDGPFCTPRSLTMAAEALALHAARPLSYDTDAGREEWSPASWPERVPLDELSYQIVGGAIGAPAAGKFFDLMRHIKDRPSFDDIVADPKGARLPVDGAVQFSIVDTLAVRVDKRSIGPVAQYVMRMPRSLMASFIRWATARDISLTQPIARSGLALKAGADLGVAMSDD
jgi:hypothetical protein